MNYLVKFGVSRLVGETLSLGGQQLHLVGWNLSLGTPYSQLSKSYMMQGGRPYKTVSSTLSDDVPFEDDDTEADLANQALAGLLEPTEEILNAIAECKTKFGGMKLNMGSMDLVSGCGGLR